MRIAVYTHDGEFVGSLWIRQKETLKLTSADFSLNRRSYISIDIRWMMAANGAGFHIFSIPHEDLDKVRKISSWKEAGE